MSKPQTRNALKSEAVKPSIKVNQGVARTRATT